MDPKKQALTPELKQIYDRVMNTQVAGKTPAGPSPTPTTNIPNTPPPEASGQPNTAPLSNPAAAQTGVVPEPAAQPFLSSVPPRPVADTKQFVFTGKKIETPNASMGGAQVQVNGSKKLSGKIIAVLVGVLIILVFL